MATLQISERPLIGVFGSQSAFQVLLYLENYDKGYASEIARFLREVLEMLPSETAEKYFRQRRRPRRFGKR